MDDTTLRLLIEIPPGPRRTLRELRTDVRGALGPGWEVAYLFGRNRSRNLSRFFVAVGSVPASPAFPLASLGYELARGLGDRIDATVEPDLPSSAYREPPLRLVGERPADRAAAALSTNSPLWSLQAVRAPQAWSTPPAAGGASRGAGMLVGHIDTGYTLHPEIAPTAIDLTRDRDILDEDDDALDPLVKRWWFPLDTPGHGTSTGSVIASRMAAQVVGAAPEAALVPIRTIMSVVQVFDSDVARAVDYARQAGCQVISMSLGGRGFNGLQAAIQRAVQSGMIVMAAAGNYVGFVTAPASYPECLAVGGTTVDDQPWTGSSRGSEVDICAPGQAVWNAFTVAGNPPTFGVGRGDGTSFSVATLAGIAAMWLAHHTPAAIRAAYGAGRVQEAFRHLVRETCRTPAGWDHDNWGAGIVDAKALLDAGLPPLPVTAGAPDGPADPVSRQLAAVWSDRPVAEVIATLTEKLGLGEDLGAGAGPRRGGGRGSRASAGRTRPLRRRDPLSGRRGPRLPGQPAATRRGGRRWRHRARPAGQRRACRPVARARGAPGPLSRALSR